MWSQDLVSVLKLRSQRLWAEKFLLASLGLIPFAELVPHCHVVFRQTSLCTRQFVVFSSLKNARITLALEIRIISQAKITLSHPYSSLRGISFSYPNFSSPKVAPHVNVVRVFPSLSKITLNEFVLSLFSPLKILFHICNLPGRKAVTRACFLKWYCTIYNILHLAFSLRTVFELYPCWHI